MRKIFQLGFLFILCLSGCVLPNASDSNFQANQATVKPNAKLQRRNQDLQLACFNSPFQEGSLSLGSPFTFEDQKEEAFSPHSTSALSPDGRLEKILGQSLKGSSLVINGVDLYQDSFEVINKLAGGLDGAYAHNTNFDPSSSLDASVTYVELKDKGMQSALACVAGVLSVENTGTRKSQIAKDSMLCFSSLGQSPYLFSSDQQILFGDKGASSSFALTLPGIRKGAQNDGLQLSVVGQEACIRFENAHELAPKGELGELASVFFTLCQVPDRKEISADFINNPKVVSFLRADIRDSLINFNQGNKANIILGGKRPLETYNVFLNGNGVPMAQIETGSDGHFSGGLNLIAAKPGDFLRFAAFDHYFDVPIEDQCGQ